MLWGARTSPGYSASSTGHPRSRSSLMGNKSNPDALQHKAVQTTQGGSELFLQGDTVFFGGEEKQTTPHTWWLMVFQFRFVLFVCLNDFRIVSGQPSIPM